MLAHADKNSGTNSQPAIELRSVPTIKPPFCRTIPRAGSGVKCVDGFPAGMSRERHGQNGKRAETPWILGRHTR
jgi:hypothetical protein